MINRALALIKRLLALAVLPVLGLLSPQAHADNFPEAQGPCGNLTLMGYGTAIYNNSQYAWNVIFKTSSYRDDDGSANAAAVKYLSDGVWIDNGTGDYRTEKTYIVPANPGQSVKIAYCADSSIGDRIVKGKVSVLWNYTGNWNYANSAHGQPDGNVKFYSVNSTPLFYNQGTTPYVNYNKNLGNFFENGSLTICPNDSTCRIP